MSVDDYCLKCSLSADEDELQFSVINNMFRDQKYETNVSFNQLPAALKFIFTSLKQLYNQIKDGQLKIYFHDIRPSVRISFKVGQQIKEQAISLRPVGDKDMFKEKRNYYEYAAQQAASQYETDKIKKQRDLQQIEETVCHLRERQTLSEMQLSQVTYESDTLELEIAQLRRQIQDRMRERKKLNPSLPESKAPTRSDLQQQVERQKYWIDYVQKMRKGQKLRMVQHIYSDKQFTKESILIINQLQLKTMQFVQIFPNLQVLDLSKNHIVKMEGLTKLKWVKRMELSYNRIVVLEGMEQMSCLKDLRINHNCILRIEGIFHMTKLQILNLSNNKLQRVPKEISKLTKIIEVNLNENRISFLDPAVLECRNLRKFSILGKPISIGCRATIKKWSKSSDDELMIGQ